MSFPCPWWALWHWPSSHCETHCPRPKCKLILTENLGSLVMRSLHFETRSPRNANSSATKERGTDDLLWFISGGLQAVRGAPGPRVQRRPQADGQAVLHQQRIALLQKVRMSDSEWMKALLSEDWTLRWSYPNYWSGCHKRNGERLGSTQAESGLAMKSTIA